MSFLSEGWVQLKKLRPVLEVAKHIFTPLAIVVIVLVAWQSKDTLTDIFSQSRLNYLVFSVLLWASVHFISPVFTLLFFRSCQQRIDYTEAFRIHAGRLPAKYLPGGIWHSVARVADYHRHGIPQRQIGVYIFAENILALSISLTLGGVSVSGLAQVNQIWAGAALLAVVFGVTVICGLPVLMNKRLIPRLHGITLRYYIFAVLSMFCFWLIAALSFIQFVSAFPISVVDISLTEVGGVYLFSWGVGFLAIFAPQGVGVSEWVLSQLLQTGMTASALLVLFATFRAVILLGDILGWAVSVLLAACRPRGV